MNDSIDICGGYIKLPVGWMTEANLQNMSSLLRAMTVLEDNKNPELSTNYIVCAINRDFLFHKTDDLTIDGVRKAIKYEIKHTNIKEVHNLVSLWELDSAYNIAIIDLYSALTKTKYDDIDTSNIDDITAKVRKLLKSKGTSSLKTPVKVEVFKFPKYNPKNHPQDEIDIEQYKDMGIITDFANLLNSRLRIAYYMYDIEKYYNNMGKNISIIANSIRK